MKAYLTTGYGSPDVLKLVEMPIPVPKQDQILIKNYVTTINSADSRLRRADPWLVRLMLGFWKPKIPVGGIVFGGTIVDNNQKISRVCGFNFETFGGFGEYLVTPIASNWAILPTDVNYQDAVSILFGGHTALYFLKKANITKDDKILIYGASGSVGVAAIQLAKYFGAEVTAVCSAKNLQKIKSLGADKVLNYPEIDQITDKFDIVYDTIGKTDVMTLAKLVKPKKTLILGAAIIKGSLLGLVAKHTKNINLIIGTAQTSKEDIELLLDLLQKKLLLPVIDRVFDYAHMREAHEYVDNGHKVGNVVVKIQEVPN